LFEYNKYKMKFIEKIHIHKSNDYTNSEYFLDILNRMCDMTLDEDTDKKSPPWAKTFSETKNFYPILSIVL